MGNSIPFQCYKDYTKRREEKANARRVEEKQEWEHQYNLAKQAVDIQLQNSREDLKRTQIKMEELKSAAKIRRATVEERAHYGFLITESRRHADAIKFSYNALNSLGARRAGFDQMTFGTLFNSYETNMGKASAKLGYSSKSIAPLEQRMDAAEDDLSKLTESRIAISDHMQGRDPGVDTADIEDEVNNDLGANVDEERDAMQIASAMAKMPSVAAPSRITLPVPSIPPMSTSPSAPKRSGGGGGGAPSPPGGGMPVVPGKALSVRA